VAKVVVDLDGLDDPRNRVWLSAATPGMMTAIECRDSGVPDDCKRNQHFLASEGSSG
jgi:hypothetical protein